MIAVAHDRASGLAAASRAGYGATSDLTAVLRLQLRRSGPLSGRERVCSRLGASQCWMQEQVRAAGLVDRIELA